MHQCIYKLNNLYNFFCRTVFNAMMLFVMVSKFVKNHINPTSVIMLQLCFIDLIGCSIQAPPVCYALVSRLTRTPSLCALVIVGLL